MFELLKEVSIIDKPHLFTKTNQVYAFKALYPLKISIFTQQQYYQR